MAESKITIEEIKQRLEELKTLNIKTVVGKFDLDDKGKIAYKEGEAKIIITRIDLLEGDITTAFSDEFLEPPYDKIREYHAEKEKQGREIITANINALKELINLINTVRKPGEP